MSDNVTAATLAELFPDMPQAATRRYRVEIALGRDGHDAAPDEDQAIADLALVMLTARGLVNGWISQLALLSIVVDAESAADAIEAGAAVVRALGGGTARVDAEPVSAELGTLPCPPRSGSKSPPSW